VTRRAQGAIAPGRRALLAVLVCVCSLVPASTQAAVPLGQLPRDVRPTHYALELTVVPSAERFSGLARIDIVLDGRGDKFWLHGNELDVSEIAVETEAGEIGARWEQVDRSGVVAVTPAQPIGPGRITLRVRWSGPLDRQLRALFRVDVGKDSYAFTQFEPVLARRAFPCFDEPVFKTPFDLTLIVPRAAAALANAPQTSRDHISEQLDRVHFATTEPLPTYLVAFAVGPLDVVDALPLADNAVRHKQLPLRGVAIRGSGPRLAYALSRVPALFQGLQAYFGIAFPFAKLDLIAVPDMAWGGMENAGAITFRESVLLIDPDSAPERQRRIFADVVTHEISHQWFGDLVTMPWWNDLWLNEAFATWMAAHIVDQVYPENQEQLQLLEWVHEAMGADSLASARRIRQPIDTPHDIENAFDDITYSKGAGVLAMFERWLGAEAFQRGLHTYLMAHRYGNASVEDLLGTLSAAAQRDIALPFASFLEQPGVPLVAARVVCDANGSRLELAQSRWLPVGSRAARDEIWQVPICVRYARSGVVREGCTLLTSASGSLPLYPMGCPTWLMPNADGAGYYRFALSARDHSHLSTDGWRQLSPRERLAVADSITAAFSAATLPAAEVLAGLLPLARDESRAVAVAPMPVLRFTRDHLIDAALLPRFETFVRSVYAPVADRLGWDVQQGENGESKLLRARVIEFLAEQGRDLEMRRRLAERGRTLIGPSSAGTPPGTPELVDVGLVIAVEDGDVTFFERVTAQLRSTSDDFSRLRLIGALGAARAPELSARARALALSPDVRIGETMRLLWRQVDDEATREATWQWMQANFDALVAHLPERDAGELPWLASGFCDDAHAAAVEAFFAPRIDKLSGGPRNLAGAIEAIRLCAARVAAQRTSAMDFFRKE
jgi:alanyl aminopeptidase